MAPNTTRRITIEVQAITRGSANVSALGREYSSMVAKAKAGVATLKGSGEALSRSINQSAKSYERLGQQIDKIKNKREALAKNLDKLGGEVNKAQFVAMTNQIIKAGEAVDKLKAKQANIAKDAGGMQKAYAQNVTAIRQAEAALSRMTSTQRRVFEAVRASASTVGRDIVRRFNDAGRQSVRSFDSVRRALETIGRQKIAPDFRVNIDPLTGGLTRAIALGTILANTLLGIGKAGINFAVSNIGAGVAAVGTLERFDLLVENIAEQQALENNTVAERVRIGSRVLSAEQQRAAAGEKAIKNAVSELDLRRSLYDIERARLSLEADTLDVAEFAPGKKDSGARADLEFRQASLNVRGSELALAEAQADYDQISTKAAEQRAKALKFVTRVVPVYQTITKVTANETELLEQQSRIKEDLLKWNKQLTLNSPFTREQVSNSFVLANAYGFSVDQAKELTTQLVDYAAATGKTSENVEGIARALGQVKAAEKLTGQEVLQLVNQGVPLYKILSKELGKSVGELRKMGEEGKLTADVVIPALQKYFKTFDGEGAKVARTTIDGILSSFSDLREFNLAALFGPPIQELKPILLDLLDLLSSDKAETFFRGIGESVSRPVKGFRILSNALKNGFGIIDSIRATWINLFPDTDLNQLETVLSIPRELEKVKEAFLQTNLGKLISDIPNRLSNLATRAVSEFGRLRGAFATSGIKGVLQELGIDASTAGKIETVAKSIGKIGEGVLELDGEKIKSAIGTIGETLFNAIKDSKIGQRAIDGFKAVATAAGTGIYNAFQNGGIGAQAVSGLGAGLGNIATQISNKFTELKLGEKIVAGTRAAVGSVGTGIREVILNAVDPKGGQGGGLASTVVSALGNIAKFLGEQATRLASQLLAAASGLVVAGIGGIAKTAIDIETEVKKKLIDAFAGILQVAYEIRQDINKALGFKLFDDVSPAVIGGGLKLLLDKEAETRKKQVDEFVSSEIQNIRERAIDRDRQIQEAFGGNKAVPIGLPPQVQSAIGAGAANATGSAFDESIVVAQQKAETFKQTIGLQSTAVKETVGLTTTDIAAKFDTMTSDVSTATETAFSNVNTIIGAKSKEINVTVDGAIKAIKQAWIVDANWPILGIEFVNGIIKGIDQQETRLYARIRELIAGAITVAKDEGAIKSPSRKTDLLVGQPLGQGIARGIVKTTQQVNEAMRALVTSAITVGSGASGGSVAPAPAPGSLEALAAEFPNLVIGPKPARFGMAGASSQQIIFSGPVNVRRDSDIKQIAWEVGTQMSRMGKK
jgi:tape measure domain-containing protein